MKDLRPPLVGISAGNNPRVPGHYILRWDYVHAVAAAGGIPVILAPSPAAERPSYLEAFGALVLSGGMDLSAVLYGLPDHETTTVTSRERDEFELGLVRHALERDLPILAICRGVQLLNVALGGTLIQDIPTMVGAEVSHDDPDRQRHVIAHSLSAASNSSISRIAGRDTFRVNSFHHQAIDRLGEGLVPLAWAEDGVIEAVELPSRSFVVGVQWHPEAIWTLGAPHLGLFEALVDATRRPATIGV